MADNFKRRFTVELGIDTGDVKRQVQKTADDLRTILTDFSKQSNKMTYFKELVDYLKQVDDEMTRFKKVHGVKAFEKMFGGLSDSIRSEVQGIFGEAGKDLSQFDVLRNKLSSVLSSGKDVAALAQIKEEIREFLDLLGMKDVDVVAFGTIGNQVEQLNQVLDEAVKQFNGIKKNIGEGFGFGGASNKGAVVKEQVTEYSTLRKAVEEYLDIKKRLRGMNDEELRANKNLSERKNELISIIQNLKELDEDTEFALYDIFDEADEDGADLNDIVTKFCTTLKIDIPKAVSSAAASASAAFKAITTEANKANAAVKSVMYHLGMGNAVSGKNVRDTFGDMLDNLTGNAEGSQYEKYGYGVLGSGLFGVQNPSLIPEDHAKNPGKFIYSVDLSKYNMYLIESEERATALMDFMSKLQKFCIKNAAPEYSGFDEYLTGVDTNVLYEQVKVLFSNADMTTEQFESFVGEMVTMLQQAGVYFNAKNNSLDFKNISEDDSLYKSENISTRFLKMLGYDGVNVGNTSLDGFGQGSVLFDFKPSDIVGYFNSIDDAIADFNNMLKDGYVGSVEQLEDYKKNINLIVERLQQQKQKKVNVSGLENQVAEYDARIHMLNNVMSNIDDILSGKVVTTGSQFAVITAGNGSGTGTGAPSQPGQQSSNTDNLQQQLKFMNELRAVDQQIGQTYDHQVDELDALIEKRKQILAEAEKTKILDEQTIQKEKEITQRFEEKSKLKHRSYEVANNDFDQTLEYLSMEDMTKLSINDIDSYIDRLGSLFEILKEADGNFLLGDLFTTDGDENIITRYEKAIESLKEARNNLVGGGGFGFGAAVDVEAELQAMRNLVQEIQDDNFTEFGDARDNVKIGQYTERIGQARAKLQEFAEQGLATAEAIETTNRALNQASEHLKGYTTAYDDYYGGHSYFDGDYSQADIDRERDRADEWSQRAVAAEKEVDRLNAENAALRERQSGSGAGAGSRAGTGSVTGGPGEGTDLGVNTDTSTLQSHITGQTTRIVEKLGETLKVEIVKSEGEPDPKPTIDELPNPVEINTGELNSALGELKGEVSGNTTALGTLTKAVDGLAMTMKPADNKQAEVDVMKQNLTQLLKRVTDFNNQTDVYDDPQRQELSAQFMSDGTISHLYGEKGAVPWDRVVAQLVKNLNSSLIMDLHSHPLHFNQDGYYKYANDHLSGSRGDLAAWQVSKRLGAQMAGMITGNILRTFNVSALSTDQYEQFVRNLADVEREYAAHPIHGQYIGINDKGAPYYKSQDDLTGRHAVTHVFEDIMYEALNRTGFSVDKINKEIFQKYDLTDDVQLTQLATVLVQLNNAAQTSISPVQRLADILRGLGVDTATSDATTALLGFEKGEMSAVDVINELAPINKHVTDELVNAVQTIDSTNKQTLVETTLDNILNVLSTINKSVNSIYASVKPNTGNKFSAAIDDVLKAKNGISLDNSSFGVKSIYDPDDVSAYRVEDVLKTAKDAVGEVISKVWFNLGEDINAEKVNDIMSDFRTALLYVEDAEKQVARFKQVNGVDTRPNINGTDQLATRFVEDLRKMLLDAGTVVDPLLGMLGDVRQKIQSEENEHGIRAEEQNIAKVVAETIKPLSDKFNGTLTVAIENDKSQEITNAVGAIKTAVEAIQSDVGAIATKSGAKEAPHESVEDIEKAYKVASDNYDEIARQFARATINRAGLQDHATLYGYTSDMSAMNAGRVRNTLSKNNRAEYVVDMLKNGHTLTQTKSGDYGFDREDLGKNVYNKITKTEYEYAQYLLSRITELNVGWEKGLQILASQGGKLEAAMEEVERLRVEAEQARNAKEAAYERMSYAHSGVFGDEAIAADKAKKNGGKQVKETADEKTEAFNKEKGVVDAVVPEEVRQLEILRQKVEEVKGAVEAKTEAFNDEYLLVDGLVPAEVEALNGLLNVLKEITAQIGLIDSGLDKIDGIQTNATKNDGVTDGEDISGNSETKRIKPAEIPVEPVVDLTSSSLKKEESAHESNTGAINAENAALKAQIELKKAAQSMRWEDFVLDGSTISLKSAAGLQTLSDMEKFWKSANYEKDVNWHELSLSEAEQIIQTKLPNELADSWYSSRQEFANKSQLENVILADDEIRNATLNYLYHMYKKSAENLYGDQPVTSFQEFLNTEFEWFRGSQHPIIYGDEEKQSFSLSKNVARQYGNTSLGTAKLAPKYTIGSASLEFGTELESIIPSNLTSWHTETGETFAEFYSKQAESVRQEINARLIALEKKRASTLLGDGASELIDGLLAANDTVLNQFDGGLVPQSIVANVDGNTSSELASKYNIMSDMQKKLFAYYVSLSKMSMTFPQEYKQDSGSSNLKDAVGYNATLFNAVLNDPIGLQKHVANLTGELGFNLFEPNLNQSIVDSLVAELKQKQDLTVSGDQKDYLATIITLLQESKNATQNMLDNNFITSTEYQLELYAEDIYAIVSQYEQQYGEVLHGVTEYFNGLFKNFSQEKSAPNDMTTGENISNAIDVDDVDKVQSNITNQTARTLQLEELRNKLIEVKDAVDAKTEAFNNERVEVGAVVDAEIAALRMLSDEIENIVIKIGEVQIAFKAVNDEGERLNTSVQNISGSVNSAADAKIIQLQGLLELLQKIASEIGIINDGFSTTGGTTIASGGTVNVVHQADKEYALDGTLKETNKTLGNILIQLQNDEPMTKLMNSLQNILKSVELAIQSMRDAAKGIEQHQKAQKGNTASATARIQDTNQLARMKGIAIDAVSTLGTDANIDSYQAMADGLVKIEGAFKNAEGVWEGFTVCVNENNEAVKLGIREHSAFAKQLNKEQAMMKRMAEMENNQMLSPEETAEMATLHALGYAHQGKDVTVQYKDSGRYTIAAREQIGSLQKETFQTFDDQIKDFEERTTVTVSTKVQGALNETKKFIDRNKELLKDTGAIDRYVGEYEKLLQMIHDMQTVDDLSDDRIQAWNQQIDLVKQLGGELVKLIQTEKKRDPEKDAAAAELFKADKDKKLSKFDLDKATLEKDSPIDAKYDVAGARTAIENATDGEQLAKAIANWETLKNQIKQAAIEAKKLNQDTSTAFNSKQLQTYSSDVDRLIRSLNFGINDTQLTADQQGIVNLYKEIVQLIDSAKNSNTDLTDKQRSQLDDKIKQLREQTTAYTDSAKSLAELNTTKIVVQESKERIDEAHKAGYFGSKAKDDKDTNAIKTYEEYISVYAKLQDAIKGYEDALSNNEDITEYQQKINVLQETLHDLDKQLVAIANQSKTFTQKGTIVGHLDSNQIQTSAESLKRLVVESEKLAVAFDSAQNEGHRLVYSVLDNGIIKKYAVEVDTATGNVRKMELSERELANAMQQVQTAAKQSQGVDSILNADGNINKDATIIQSYTQAKKALNDAVQQTWDKAKQNNGVIDQEDLNIVYAIAQEVIRLGSVVQNEYKKIANLKGSGGLFNQLGGDVSGNLETRMRQHIGDIATNGKQNVANVQYDSATKTMTADLVSLSGEISKVKLQYNELFDGVQVASMKGTQAIDETENKIKSLKTSIDDAIGQGLISKDLEEYQLYSAAIIDLQKHIDNINNGSIAFNDSAIQQWNLLRQSVTEAGNALLEVAKVKSTEAGQFDKSYEKQVDEFDQYRKSLDGVSYITKEAQDRIDALFNKLNGVKDSADLTAWQEEFKKLKTDVDTAKGSFEAVESDILKKLRGRTNAAFSGLDFKDTDTLFDTEQVAIVEQYRRIFKLLDEQRKKVKRGEKVELSAINSVIDALEKKISTYKKDRNLSDVKTKNFGATATRREDTRHNKLFEYGARGYSKSSKFSSMFTTYDAEYNRLIEKQKTLSSQDVITKEQLAEFDILKSKVVDLGKELERMIKTSEKLKDGAWDTYDLDSDFDDTRDGRERALTDYINGLSDFEVQSIKFKDNWQECVAVVKDSDGTFKQVTATIDQFGNRIVSNIDDAGDAVNNLGQFIDLVKVKFGQIFAYLTASFGIEEFFQQIRQGIEYVREIDGALTELKKVTNETDAEYEHFLQNMSKTAGIVGSTVAELTKSAADWARLNN